MQLYSSRFESQPQHKVLGEIKPNRVICGAKHGNKCVVWETKAKNVPPEGTASLTKDHHHDGLLGCQSWFSF